MRKQQPGEAKATWPDQLFPLKTQAYILDIPRIKPLIEALWGRTAPEKVRARVRASVYILRSTFNGLSLARKLFKGTGWFVVSSLTPCSILSTFGYCSIAGLCLYFSGILIKKDTLFTISSRHYQDNLILSRRILSFIYTTLGLRQLILTLELDSPMQLIGLPLLNWILVLGVESSHFPLYSRRHQRYSILYY